MFSCYLPANPLLAGKDCFPADDRENATAETRMSADIIFFSRVHLQ